MSLAISTRSPVCSSSLPTPVSPSTSSPAPFPKQSRAPLHIDTNARRPAPAHPPTPTSPAQRASGSGSGSPYPYYTPRRLRSSSTATVQTPTSALLSPADPYTDITRLRLQPSSLARHPCLYPGASFAGTQRSGRHAYEVRVTLATVDLAAAHVCGYLRIKGLTDDYPELTTYFDADVITSTGGGNGFRTPKSWGACESRDWQHWTRFPAFRRLKLNDLDQRPEAGEGAVFMRWKEKFLVPDHRVKDITGASFAGFYYVCVDLDPSASSSSASASATTKATTPRSSTPEEEEEMESKPAPGKLDKHLDEDGDLVTHMDVDADEAALMNEDEEDDVPPGDGALMSGYYFHPHSDPFQKLSLRHVKDEGPAGFEFR